jgi:hypothetical protein
MSHSVKFVVALFCGCNISAQPRGVVAVFRYLDKQSFVYWRKIFHLDNLCIIIWFQSSDECLYESKF